MATQPVIPFETTLTVRDTCLCMHVRRAARALARRYDEALKPMGLTNGQFSILMALNRPGSAGMADVAELLALDRTTLTANLKPLERRGLLVASSGSDRRSRWLSLTDAGRASLLAALPAWEAAQREVEAELTDLKPEALRTGLRALA